MTLQTKCLNDVQYSRLIDNTADEVSWWCIMKNTHVTLTTPNIKKFSSQPSTQWVSNYTRHSERGKKARQTEEEVGRQHQGMHRPGFGKSQRAVENREKWRKVVAKSSVVPQRPSRLRDWWWWWWLWTAYTVDSSWVHVLYQINCLLNVRFPSIRSSC